MKANIDDSFEVNKVNHFLLYGLDDDRIGLFYTNPRIE